MYHATEHHHVSSEMQKCINDCLECHSICLTVVPHCLRLGGEHAAPDHIRLLLDCAEICQTSANFMLRGSLLHGYTCGICAVICDMCAKDCERLMGDDAMMQECSAICYRCAESCRQMANQVPS